MILAGVVVVCFCAGIWFKRFVTLHKCEDDTRLDGKTVLITGANSGIGKATALELARRGAHVIMGCRSMTRGEQAVIEIFKQLGTKADVTLMQLDLGSLACVRNFVKEYKEKHKNLDILINNAGVTLPNREETEDGFEMQFGVNHLGHFLLTNLLLDLIKESVQGRIVNVSSRSHLHGKINFDDIMSKKSYLMIKAYAQSKLANILFSLELQKRLQGTRVTVNSLHPGAVMTEIGRHLKNNRIYHIISIVITPLAYLFTNGITLGAQTSVYCAVSPALQNVSGKYFSDCSLAETAKAAKDEDVARRLWEISEEYVGLK